jgi:hypothetical protein
MPTRSTTRVPLLTAIQPAVARGTTKRYRRPSGRFDLSFVSWFVLWFVSLFVSLFVSWFARALESMWRIVVRDAGLRRVGACRHLYIRKGHALRPAALPERSAVAALAGGSGVCLVARDGPGPDVVSPAAIRADLLPLVGGALLAMRAAVSLRLVFFAYGRARPLADPGRHPDPLRGIACVGRLRGRTGGSDGRVRSACSSSRPQGEPGRPFRPLAAGVWRERDPSKRRASRPAPGLPRRPSVARREDQPVRGRRQHRPATARAARARASHRAKPVHHSWAGRNK